MNIFSRPAIHTLNDERNRTHAEYSTKELPTK